MKDAVKDEILVAELKDGQMDKFPELVNLYKNRIFSMAYRFTANNQDAEDLSQEIFLIIYRNIKSFREQSSLSTWIYRIAVNRCITWQRKHKGRNEKIKRAHPEDDRDPLNTIPDARENTEGEILRREQAELLKKCLTKLPEKYSKVISLYHFQELSYKEIGEILEISPRTVETRLYRARKQLKLMLGDYHGEESEDGQIIDAADRTAIR